MTLDAFLQREIELGSFPAASYAIGSVDGLERANALGHGVAVPLRIGATTETIFDCASITKPLLTGTLVLQAVAEGRIALDDEYRGYTYRELLTHTSGLKSWLPLYAMGDYLKAIEEHGPEAPRGSRVMYSDLNFVLLFHALEELCGSYREAVRERIFEPLGLKDSFLATNEPAWTEGALRSHPSGRLAQVDSKPTTLLRIAATEWGQRFEYGMCASRSVVFTGFRQGLMWGETNDGNSFHAGGTCGNAGLFATARDVFRIVQGLAGGELVPRELMAEATREQAPARGLAWQLRGPGLSDDSFGHMGFTGTSVWIDRQRIFVLLTNRVHPCAAPIGMQRIREEFHRLSSSPSSSMTS